MCSCYRGRVPYGELAQAPRPEVQEGQVTPMEKSIALKQYYKTQEGAENQSSATEGFIRETAELVCAVLRERLRPQKALDVGCARGELVSAWHRHGVEAYGVDISDYAVSHPRNAGISEYLGAVDVECERLPFDDDTFDIATVLEVLEHLEQPSLLLGELRRVVKDAGFVFVTTPALPFETRLWRTLGIQSNPLHINVHSKRFWVRSFEKHGFAYTGELRSFIREANTSIIPADGPLQHWALRLVGTKLGKLGKIARIELKCLVHAALLFQNRQGRTGSDEAAC
jgi:2-polyprenyl-3-methyl-5-hydroxy-6-metoxy-1,4-benzoquinol methylase